MTKAMCGCGWKSFGEIIYMALAAFPSDQARVTVLLSNTASGMANSGFSARGCRDVLTAIPSDNVAEAIGFRRNSLPSGGDEYFVIGNQIKVHDVPCVIRPLLANIIA